MPKRKKSTRSKRSKRGKPAYGVYKPKQKRYGAPSASELKVANIDTGILGTVLGQPSCYSGLTQIDGADAVADPSVLGNMLMVPWVNAGIEVTMRTGNQIWAQYLELRGEVSNMDAANVPHIARLIVVLDKVSAGAIPAIADLLNPPDATCTSSYVFATRNLNYRERFTFLKDELFNLSPANMTSAHVPFHFVIPMRYKVQYSAAALPAGTEWTAVTKNNIWVIMLASAATHSKVTWRCHGSFRYVDP